MSNTSQRRLKYFDIFEKKSNEKRMKTTNNLPRTLNDCYTVSIFQQKRLKRRSEVKEKLENLKFSISPNSDRDQICFIGSNLINCNCFKTNYNFRFNFC